MLIRGELLAKNAALNFIGQLLPLVAGIVILPLLVRTLGVDRFGLLSLAWVLLAYFTLFDLGLGQATTKYVSMALATGNDDQVADLTWTAVASQLLIGAIIGVALFQATPLVVDKLLNVSATLQPEAIGTFRLIALIIPFGLVSSSLAGVLQAAQRFDLLNATRAPVNVATYVLPLVGALLGLDLPGIVFLILLSRCALVIVIALLDVRLFPSLRSGSIRLDRLRCLVTYGGWLSVSNAVSPAITYLDRFFVASILSTSAVAYYTAPYEAVVRLSVVPISLATTVFPVFSALDGLNDQKRLESLLTRSVKYTLLAAGPIIVLMMVFADEILRRWLGPDFATRGAVVLQIIGLGALVNFLAVIFSEFLKGTGRPDLPAKFHLLELPIHVSVSWLLVTNWGLAGAAAAWTLRVSLDAVLLFWATVVLGKFSALLLVGNSLALTAAGLIALGIAFGVLHAVTSDLPLVAQMGLVGIVLGTAAWLGWTRVLDTLDRSTLIQPFKLR